MWSPFDRSIKHNPYPHYAWQREEKGLFIAPGRVVYSLDYRSAKFILNNDDDFRSNPPQRTTKYALPGFDRIMEHCLLTSDGSHHKQSRSIMSDVFDLGEVEQSIQFKVDTLLAGLQDHSGFDLVKELIEPVVAASLMRILGFESEHEAKALEWSDRLIRSVDIYLTSQRYLEIEKASLELEEFISEALKNERLGGFTAQVFNKLKVSEPSEAALSKTTSFTATLLFTGVNTVIGLIGNILFQLLSQPELFEQLLAIQTKQGKISVETMEELIRLYPSVHFTFRFANRDTRVDELSIAKDQVIAVCLAAANRDPEIFKQPDTFIPNRLSNPHLSFGSGKHYCFGAKMARMLLKILLPALMKVLPGLQLQSIPPDYKRYNFVMAPESLPVKAI